jgi:hypothetical protein
MSTYETRIGQVVNSTFAIGDNAKAEEKFARPDRDEMAEALRVLVDIVSRYTDPAAEEVLDLADAASREIDADQPRKEVFRRLADATRTMMTKLGSGIIGAGALADAVTKITDLIHHL